jgi:hypothetical protein
METMVDVAMKQVTAKAMLAGTALKGVAIGGFSGVTQLSTVTTNMERMVGVSGRLNQSLNKMSGMFGAGLGMGATVVGLGALGMAFTRAIEKAEKFQTAQLSIQAILLSTYKIQTPQGKPAGGVEAFIYTQSQAQKYNMQIIERSRKNILSYEEQLQSFQTGLAAGGRKGLLPEKVMDISETIAVASKAIGLRGERISEQVRILLGGGVNVQRSMLAKILGIKTQDIATRSGEELTGFIGERLKGFKDPRMMAGFSKSIEAVLTTMASQLDVFLAGVGKKIMKNITPALQELGKVMEGGGAEKIGDILSGVFISIFKALEAIAKSPAIPMFMKFLEFMAGYGDKIIIGAVILQLGRFLITTGTSVGKFIMDLRALGATAAVTAQEINAVAVATERSGVAMGSGRVGGFGLGSKVKGVAPEVVGLGGLYGSRSVYRSKETGRFISKAVAEEEQAAMMAATKTPAAPGFMASMGGAKGLGGKLLGGAMTGAMAYGGIKIGASMAGLDKGAVGAGMDALAIGAGVGLLLAPVMGPLAIIPAVIAAASKFLLDLHGQLVDAQKQFEDADKDLQAMRKKYPTAAKITDIKTRIQRLNEAIGNMQSGEGGGLLTGKVTPQSLEVRKKELETEIKDLRSTGSKQKPGLKFMTETTAGDLASIQKNAEASLKEVGIGSGILREKQKLYWEFAVKAAQVRSDLQAMQIKIVDNDLKDKQDEITRATWALKAVSDKQHGVLSKTDANKLAKLQDEEAKLQQTQAHRLIEEARGSLQNNQRKLDLQRKSLLASLDESPITGKKRQGLLKIEEDMLGKKDILGADYPAALKRARENFIKMFNEPLKRIELEITNLSLGVAGEHPVTAIILAYKSAIAKINEAVSLHLMTIADGIRATAEQTAKMQSDVMLAKYEQANQAFGATPIARIYGKAQSAIMQKELESRALMTGAQGGGFASEMYSTLSGIEGQRGKLAPAEFEQFRGARIGQEVNKIQGEYATGGLQQQMMPLAQEQRTLGLQQQALAVKTFDWNLTERDQREQAKAEKVVRREAAEERGPVSFAARMAAAREAMDTQRRLGEVNLEAANIQEAMNKINDRIVSLDLATKMESYSGAIEAATDYLNGMVKGGKTPVGFEGSSQKAAATGVSIPINIQGGGGLTQKDIDQWIPQIRAALCKLVSQTGARG